MQQQVLKPLHAARPLLLAAVYIQMSPPLGAELLLGVDVGHTAALRLPLQAPQHSQLQAQLRLAQACRAYHLQRTPKMTIG